MAVMATTLPTHLVSDVVLRDGSTVRVRPTPPSDVMSRSRWRRRARDGGVGRYVCDDEVGSAVDAMMWEPRYLPYEPA
jgi:hypothetical protein